MMLSFSPQFPAVREMTLTRHLQFAFVNSLQVKDLVYTNCSDGVAVSKGTLMTDKILDSDYIV